MTTPIPELLALSSLDAASGHDALVLLVGGSTDAAAAADGVDPRLGAAVRRAIALDAAIATGRSPNVVAAPELPGQRLVLQALGALDRDVDDVRAVGEAAAQATLRAIDAGARRPALAVAVPSDPRFARAREVAALAALGSQWQPLEAREAGKAQRTAEAIGVLGLDATAAAALTAREAGRALCRDICGTEPERMAPLRVAALCEEAFAGTAVKVSVERDVSGYPLLAAVARASQMVERHRPCVVRLEVGPADAPVQLVLAGKGVTYDTGGADLKTNGHMAGMSRDKGGAAAVAGLIATVAKLGLPNVRVVGLLGLVRNSVGEESFVSDEIIASRAGVRVRIGNTDAEGRLVLADLLAAGAEELAKSTAKTRLLASVATLTGHVYRALGPYVGMLGNATARAPELLPAIAAEGELWGEPMEVERPRREDYVMIAGRGPAEDVVSCNRLASVDTPRGHQFPYAFLEVTAGLTRAPYAFAHLDIGGAAVAPADWQFGKPTGSPILAFTSWLERAGR